MAKKEKSFEEALNELEEIVEQLEKGDVMLADALEKFQRGMELSRYCNDTLTKAEQSVADMLVKEPAQLDDEVAQEQVTD